jgi:hypothetical protein
MSPFLQQTHDTTATLPLPFACYVPPLPNPPQTHLLYKALKRAWKLACNDTLKTAFWLLSSDCIPGVHIPHPYWVCPCSSSQCPSCSRLHSLWDCSITTSICPTLESALSLPALPHSNLWLMIPPTASINPEVWTLVCLAAISAMDYGHASFWSTPRDTSTSPVVAHFWHTLQSYAPDSPSLESPCHANLFMNSLWNPSSQCSSFSYNHFDLRFL